MGAEVVYNHADYRLLSSAVLKELAEYKEVNLYLRGLIPLVGFESDIVTYERNERLAGKTHYSFSKMLSLAFDGITGLSIKPVRLILLAGIILAVTGLLGSIISAVNDGNISLICFIISLFTGINLVGFGIVGEYAGKIYMEVKARPRYIINKRTYQKTDR